MKSSTRFGSSLLSPRSPTRRGLALLLAILLVPTLPALADDVWAEVDPWVRQADAAFAGGDDAAASAAYGRASERLAEAHRALEATTAKDLAFLARWKSKTADEILAKLEEKTSDLNALASRIAKVELALARSLTRAGRLEEACRAVGRAAGYDLPAWEVAVADEALAPLQSHPGFQELRFRIEKGRGHIDTGDPIEYVWGDLAHRRSLRLPPGDVGLTKAGPIEELLASLTTKRAGAEAPARLTFEEYDRLCRLGRLLPKTHFGWAYRHEHLFVGGPAIHELAGECLRRFEARRDERDGPFRALVAFFPALHQGETATMRTLLDYLAERSPLLMDRALDGERWLLKTYLEAGEALPGTTRAVCRTLLEKADEEYEAIDLDVLLLQAWQGVLLPMTSLGQKYVLGGHGLDKDPLRGVPWLVGAAASDYAPALFILGECTMNGAGVEKDPARAVELLVRAADLGYVPAFNQAGYDYQYGIGVEQDYEIARRLFERGADAGDMWAADSLGILLHRGLGGGQDYDAAERAYRKSLTAGGPIALRRLGNLALDRRASDGDLQTAADYLVRAAESKPDDWPACLYLWTVLQLQGKPEAARDAAKRLADGFEAPARKAFAKALADARVSESKLLREAKKEKEEDARQTLVGQAYYLGGILALVKDKPRDARKSFERAAQKGHITDSLMHSAQAELRRLDAGE